MQPWLNDAIFYQIYPQSFHDSNADGIGDFQGIIQKLDYIQDTGFNALWLNPCFDSPFGDAGYDVRDYFLAAKRYGTNEDLKALFHAVHDRGMHILLDLVPGHTSVECSWFQSSMEPEENPYTHRYVWTNSINKDIAGVSGIAGTIRGISDRDGCCGVNYYSCQPALNYGFAQCTEAWQQPVDAPGPMATRQAMLEVIRFWLGLGCDGFRVDMAFSLVKNDPDRKQTIALWQDIFSKVSAEFPEAAFVAEWGAPEQALPAGFDMDFMLHFGPSHYRDLYHCNTPYFSPRGEGSAKEFFAYYTTVLAQTKALGGLISFPSGNHDMPRLSYHCDPHQIKLVFAFMMSMPGAPFVYYGDEIGMRYLPVIRSKEGGYKRTGARTPMQWDNSPNFGFSRAPKALLYTPQDPAANAPTVASQQEDADSVLNELKRLMALRKENPVLQASADFKLLCDDYPMVYLRQLEDCQVLVAINPTDTQRSCAMESLCIDRVLYSIGAAATMEGNTLTVPPLSASYLVLQ